MKLKSILFLFGILITSNTYCATATAIANQTGLQSVWRSVQKAWESSKLIQEGKKIASLGDVVKYSKLVLDEANKTKQFIGDLASTVSNVESMLHTIETDFKSVTSISKNQKDDINEFFNLQEDWRRGKAGDPRYRPILDLKGWYDFESAIFKDKNGNINASSYLYNSNDAKQYMEKRSQIYLYQYKIDQATRLLVTKDVEEKLKEARLLDRAARRLALYVNVATAIKSGRRTVDLFADTQNGKIRELNIEGVSNGNIDKDAWKAVGGLSEKDILDLTERAMEMSSRANKTRNDALVLARKYNTTHVPTKFDYSAINYFHLKSKILREY